MISRWEDTGLQLGNHYPERIDPFTPVQDLNINFPG